MHPRFVVAAQMSILISACADGDARRLTGPRLPSSVPAEIVVTPPEALILDFGERLQFEARGVTVDGDTVPIEVSWHTTDWAVVNIDQAGLAQPNGFGFAAVYAATDLGLSDSAQIRVPNPTIEVSPDTVTLFEVGQTATLSVLIRDERGEVLDLPPAFSSSDTSIVGVSPDGVVTARGGGAAVISVVLGPASASVPAEVHLPSLILSPSSAVFHGIGSSRRFTAAIRDRDGSMRPATNVTWSVTNPDVGEIDADGLFTARRDGQVTVVAREGALSGSAVATITVTDGVAPVVGWMTTGTFTGLADVWGAAAGAVYAVGNNGVILHFDGTQWSGMNSPVSAHLYTVWGTGPNEVYAAGDEGVFLRYDGAEWRVLPSAPGDVSELWGVSSKQVFAVGPRGLYEFDGTRWRAVPISTTLRVTRWDLRSVYGFGPTDVFAAGTVYFNVMFDMPPEYKSVLVRFDGDEYRADESTHGQGLFAMWGTSPTDVYAVGVSMQQPLAYRFNGTVWSPLDLEIAAQSIWGTSATEMFVGGMWLDAAILQFDGLSWQRTNVPYATVTGIWGTTSSSVWAVASGHLLEGRRE